MSSFVNLGEGFVLPLGEIAFIAPDQDTPEIFVVTYHNGHEVNIEEPMLNRLIQAMRLKCDVIDATGTV